ncbi:3-hydroxyacyl-CoA dehydrogenase [Acinetobacter puyangensis]|uniref:NAD(P)-dependent dehydrogenase, short-chain alcohol dehydrogenase family n=1 Tax=Acinetobacter puyangensis TaxID=1096779 RepID=A0A240EC45_9GAMM|nr:SDR family NAD(P)-dependent oxidoreductase [Acinetobacter puyangensis]SNX45749.1 NAD(P)-dependent dehydrogenase, short-chain alcohol dehydrogenase family [Acinetobacter puyangensis]
MKIEGNLFLITGAASGLGYAVACQLVQNHASVVLIDINEEGLKKAVEQLGIQARYECMDITNELQAQQFFKQLKGQKISGLINCAGIAPAEKVLKKEDVHRLESFSRTLNINVIGSFNMIRFAAQAMSQNEVDTGGEKGIIINTASVAAYEGQIGQVAYAASKGAVVAMTLPLARELARDAIRVMTIAPGIMATPMLLNMPVEVQQALGDMVPFPKRLGQPEEFAKLAQHIIENTYLNGEVIRLDGAIRMAAK